MLRIILIAVLALFLLGLLIPRPAVSVENIQTEIPEIKPDVKTYSMQKTLEVFGDGQWESFNNIIKHESRWDPYAQNPHSSAYGLGQFLDDTWDDVGCIKTSDPYTQIDCTILYIKARYGTPKAAWTKWQSRHPHWY